jgi:hypothetical protein
MADRPYVYLHQGCADARDLEFKTPDGIVRCFACEGNGKYVQRYIEGSMTGSCDWCKAFGFRYEDADRPVSESVLNQIAVASNLEYQRCDIYGIDWRRAQSEDASRKRGE